MIRRVCLLALISTVLGHFACLAQATEFTSKSAPKGRAQLSITALSRTYVTRLGKGRKGQIKRLRLERVLADYDKSKIISEKSGVTRSKALRDLVTASSTNNIKSSLAKAIHRPAGAEAKEAPEPEELKTYQDNVRAALTSSRGRGFARIWHGAAVTKPDVYPDAVFISGQGVCTGTLVSPYHVITAAHCMCDGVTKDVTVGTSIADVIQRANIDLNKSKTNIPCDLLKNDEFSNIKNGDLALYWLKTPIKGILLRKIASEELLRGSKLIRAVGFGLTSNDKWGTKFAIDIPISSYDCTEPKFDTGKYRCSANSELSAAGLNRDTCEGDSGGPTYVLGKDVSLYLAAVTSRSIKPDSSCGKGGIYVKLTTKTVRDWLVKNGVPTSAFAQ